MSIKPSIPTAGILIGLLTIGGSTPSSADKREVPPSEVNVGYELTGGIDLWESAPLEGGGFSMTGRIESAWAMPEFNDPQPCDDETGEEAMTSTPSAIDMPDPKYQTGTAPSAEAIIHMVQAWGVCPRSSCGSDLTGDGLVETADLLRLLFNGEH